MIMNEMSENGASKIKVDVAFCVVSQQKPSLIRQFLAHFQYSVKDNRSKTLDAQTSRCGLQTKALINRPNVHLSSSIKNLSQSPTEAYVSNGANYTLHKLGNWIGLVDLFFRASLRPIDGLFSMQEPAY